MMPLTLASTGESSVIKKVGGSPAVKQHLEDLGFVPGTDITVINSINGNLIVCVKNVRIAISREMAQRIMI